MPEFFETSLAAILSVTTGRLLCDLYEMYDLLDYMDGDASAMTHHRPEQADRVAPMLLAQFPRLAEAQPPEFAFLPDATEGDKWAAVRVWVKGVGFHAGLGERVPVTRPTLSGGTVRVVGEHSPDERQT